MARIVYNRRVPLSRWNTRLQWIKSGSYSRPTEMPYEIYSKRYGPTALNIGVMNADLIMRLGSELRDVIRAKRFKRTNVIRASVTAVLGVDTQQKARQAYRSSGRKATLHTKHWELVDTNSFLSDIHTKLDYLSELPSAPSWLVAVDITIYLEKEDVDRIKRSGNVEMLQ